MMTATASDDEDDMSFGDDPDWAPPHRSELAIVLEEHGRSELSEFLPPSTLRRLAAALAAYLRILKSDDPERIDAARDGLEDITHQLSAVIDLRGRRVLVGYLRRIERLALALLDRAL
jgi:hypothetical protein